MMAKNDHAFGQVAKERADAVIAYLSGLGVTASLVGSLVQGRFDEASDIDFLVSDCPKRLKYTFEARVEDMMGHFKFDLVYADETPAHKLSKMLAARAITPTNA